MRRNKCYCEDIKGIKLNNNNPKTVPYNKCLTHEIFSCQSVSRSINEGVGGQLPPSDESSSDDASASNSPALERSPLHQASSRPPPQAQCEPLSAPARRREFSSSSSVALLLCSSVAIASHHHLISLHLLSVQRAVAPTNQEYLL